MYKESLSKTHQTALKIAILALSSSQTMLVISEIYKVIVRFRTPKPLAPSAPPPSSQKTFADMEGMDDLKERLQRVIKSWTCRADFEGYAISPTNGVLFYGPPGTGKTLAAECLAGEMKLAFYKFSLGDLSSKYVGETANNINLLFKQVKQKGGGVIFIDEIETLVKKRNNNNESYSSLENDKGVTEFLIQLQNASPTILVLAATNHLDNIDPAILRPGRFDLKIEISLPDAKARAALLKHYLSKNEKLKLIDESNYLIFGECLEGYSPSDIQEMAEEIAYLAMNDNRADIDVHHIKTVLLRRGITINQGTYPR
jgi:cell division protease FtsH